MIRSPISWAALYTMGKSPAGSVFQAPVTNSLPARFTHRETLQEVRGQKEGRGQAISPPSLLYAVSLGLLRGLDPAREVPAFARGLSPLF